jgi:uncharacterized membrane-anchored protein
MKLERTLLLVAALLVLGLINHAIWQKEQLLANGDIVRLKLAPVDPRSLMQGDYMRLDFEVARAVRNNPKDDGLLVVALDASRVASLRRIHTARRSLPTNTSCNTASAKGRRGSLPMRGFFRKARRRCTKKPAWGSFAWMRRGGLC